MSETPPRWDLTEWFADFGADFERWLADCDADLSRLDAEVAALPALTTASLAPWTQHLLEIESLSRRIQHAGAYANARAATNVDDAAANAATARLARIGARFSGISAVIVDRLGQADDATFAALCARPELAGGEYYLSRLRARAQRSMSPSLERLAGDLGVDGISAWGRLYREVTSSMRFELDGEQVPLAWLRSSLQSPDAGRRQRALDGAGAALAARGKTFAACINAIAGARLTLDRARGLSDPLDDGLFAAATARETLDAMMGVVDEHLELGRRFLRLKARLMGVERLGWADVRGPLPSAAGAPSIPWSDARGIVLDAFAQYHPHLHDYALGMFEGKGIEAEARPGKRPGAFCTRSFHAGSSRVYMSFTGASAELRTLAHELGHAYHNHVMRDLRTWARRYPMTLAETASIVAETLVSDAWLANPEADDDERLRVLAARLGQVATYLLDIPTRLAFEKAFYAERAKGLVSVERLGDLMEEAQLSIFGDVLDPERTHRWYWAEKLHFFLPGVRFYNFPYTFGYLFGMGVLARARTVGPETFHPTYIELLRRTGQGTVEEVAREVLGVDLTGPAFWRSALDGAKKDLAAFEALVDAR